MQDWSYCKPSARQTAVHQRDLGEGKFCVQLPGDPVCWIFSKTNPCPSSHSAAVGKDSATSANAAAAAAKNKIHSNVTDGLEGVSVSQRLAQERQGSITGVTYLIEVHFMLQLITGDPTIVPLGRHMFGELSRTLPGCKMLQEEGVVSSLLAEARLSCASRSDGLKGPGGPVSPVAPGGVGVGVGGEAEDAGYDSMSIQHSLSAESLVLFDEDPPAPIGAGAPVPEVLTEEEAVSRVKAAIWALGHIGSTDNGFEALQSSDPDFVAWCVHMATHAPTFSVRSVCFSALGLLSRSDKSQETFAQLGWDFSSNHCSAVATPNDLSVLFNPVACVEPVQVKTTNANPDHIPTEIGNSPLTKTSLRFNRVYLYTLITGVNDVKKRDLYCDVLECIAKLPGHILYRETKGKLAALRSKHAEIFSQRELYLATQHVLLLFSFTLTIRRHVFGLFHADARMQRGPTLEKKKKSSVTSSPMVSSPLVVDAGAR
jgi:hypothetical protein